MGSRAEQNRRPLRVDAERNRRRIIAAARELFADRGLDVSLDDVAERAGVGVGTVYRRFANRDELIAGVLVEHLHEVVDHARAARDNPDPWSGVVEMVGGVVGSMAADRGLRAVITRTDHEHPEIAALKTDLGEQAWAVFDRALAAGVLRPDLAASDMFAIVAMLTAVAEVTESAVPGTWRRYLELLLDSIRTEPVRAELTVAALTEDQMTIAQRDTLQAARRRAFSAKD
ncbi:TetR/AcrR family transcriptional regulator [Gordonia sp. NPDC003376]